MRYKFIVIGLLLLALQGVYTDDEQQIMPFEPLEIGKQVEDQLTENQRKAYYEVLLDEIYSNQDFIVIVKGKSPFDDPEVRIAFSQEDLTFENSLNKIYQCQNVGREICIIPADDLIEKKRNKEKTKVFIEVTQRGTGNCKYIIEVEYEEKQTYQFGKEYTINLKQDLYKQITLKFDETLKGTETISNIFASIIPLQQGLIEDKIEFTAIVRGNKIKGIEIWENGLGLSIRNSFINQSSQIDFTIYSSSEQQFIFSTISPKTEISLPLQEIKKGYLFQDESTVYAIDLSQVQGNHEDLDLVLHVHPYFGRASISINAEKNFKEQSSPNWHFEAWASEQIVIKGKDRLNVYRQDEIYYVRVQAKQELTYSLKAYLYDKDQLSIQFHDSVVGINMKDEITNYQLKIVSNDIIQVRAMLFNIQGDNDLYIKQCPVYSTTSCQVTQKDITDYENSPNQDDQSIFIVAKVGDAKREFITFSHKGKCADDAQQNTCRYMIALKGTSPNPNKYVLRANNDAQHTLLQNNVAFKDKAEKFEFNFYKYQSPALGNIEQIDFIITTFVGQVIVRTSRENKQPRRDNFEKINNESQIISYTKKEFGNLSETTFYISAFGEIDSIYTITPHLIFSKQDNINEDPGILIIDGVKQDVYLTQDKYKQYFYFKVPMNDDKVPKVQLNLIAQSGAYKVYLDPNQKVILEKPDNATFKNSEVNNQITIHEGTLDGEMILYGLIEPLNEIKESNEKRVITLYYHTDYIAYEFELNKSHSHFFYKKKQQHFTFQIKEYTNYYISVITSAQNQYKLDFYVSLDQRNNRPSHEHQTGRFKAFEGYTIDQYQIDQFCPFISQSINSGKPSTQSCNVYLTGYAYADIMSTITISNEGSIFQLYEGINFRTAVPLPNQFSYFVHEIKPSVEHTKIEVTTNASHLQIYASIYIPNKDEQSSMLKKSFFPTSQNSEYQSNLDLFNEGSAQIQLHTKEIKDCQLFGCKVLLTIDNLDKKFRQSSDNYMNVLVTNEKTIQEIIEGKDYELPLTKGGISYFKYIVGEDVKRIRVELLGIPKDQEDEINTYNYLLVSNHTSGLPTYENNQQVDVLYNLMNIAPEKGQKYIKPGMYYFGVILNYVDNPVNLRLTTNQIQIINMSLDGRQRDISLDPSEIAYAVVDPLLVEDDTKFELIVLNPTSEFNIDVYADLVFQRINGIKEIEDIVKSNVKVGEMKNDVHRIKFTSNTKKNAYHYIIKIQSFKFQTLTFLLRTKNTIQSIYQGSYFKDVLAPSKYRIFDLNSDYTKVKITLFSGELLISTLPKEKTTILDEWITNKQIIEQIEFNQKWNNSLEIPFKKNEGSKQNEYLLIENKSDKNEAFYFIENIEATAEKEQKSQVLMPTHPRSGSLSPGQTTSYIIENKSLSKATFKLSIFFPSLSIREQFNEKVNLPEIKLTSPSSSNKIDVIDQKKTASQFYYEFSIDTGKINLNITRILSDYSLNNIQNGDVDLLEYIISLDTSGIMHAIDNAKYYQKQTSKSQVSVFEYFRQWGTPFIVEVFDCIGETSLALSENLKAVKDFSSDLIVRYKSMGHYKYYTFSTFEEQEQNEEDFKNHNDNNEDDDDFVKSSVLYIGAKPRTLDPYIKRTEYILRVSSFPSNHQAFMLPFEYFYLKENSIFVEQIGSKEGRGLKFTAPNVRCEQQCLHIRAKVNHIIYQLYITDSESSLQDYSVCHTNMTNYKDLSITKFPEAKSSSGHLLLRQALKSNGLAIKTNIQPIFEIQFKDITERPQEIYYTITATVNIQEYGSAKAQNIPVFYKKQKLTGKWWNECIECEVMQKEKEKKISEQEETITEKEDSDKEESSTNLSQIMFILFMILIALVGLYSLYRIVIYCRNRGYYSLKSIFTTHSNSSFELNDYHSYG